VGITYNNMKSNIKIKTNEENPEPVEIIASSIIAMTDAFEKIQNTHDRRGLVVLIKGSNRSFE